MNATELTVTVYLNTTTDELDRPLGIIDGYDQTHSFEQVAQWIDTTTPGDRPITLADLHTIAEHAFFLFNVGDDPDMTGEPPIRARSRTGQPVTDRSRSEISSPSAKPP